MKSLEKRIERLEKKRGVECSMCGYDGMPITEVKIVEHVEGPKNCPECRRPLWFTLDLGELGGKHESEEPYREI